MVSELVVGLLILITLVRLPLVTNLNQVFLDFSSFIGLKRPFQMFFWIYLNISHNLRVSFLIHDSCEFSPGNFWSFFNVYFLYSKKRGEIKSIRQTQLNWPFPLHQPYRAYVRYDMREFKEVILLFDDNFINDQFIDPLMFTPV
jgi:hypothetical protein